jgi:hypothetical protein
MVLYMVLGLLQENHLKIIPLAVPSPIVISKSKLAGDTREFHIILLCFSHLHSPANLNLLQLRDGLRSCR